LLNVSLVGIKAPQEGATALTIVQRGLLGTTNEKGMRISIYAPNGAHLETITPKQNAWSVEREGKDDMHIRFKEYPNPGPRGGCVTDRLKIYGSTIVIIQEEKDNV
jgi:hypothetical protein